MIKDLELLYLKKTDIIFTQNEFDMFLKDYEEAKLKGGKCLARFIAFIRESNSIDNILKNMRTFVKSKKKATIKRHTPATALKSPAAPVKKTKKKK